MPPVVAVSPSVTERLLSEFPEYPAVILQLLANRGLTTAQAIEDFLDPQYRNLHDPFLFKHMRRACERLYGAIENHELVAIHGDYDADGVSGSVILNATLSSLGAKTMVFLPHREKDGYGLNMRTVDYLNEQGARVIVTCDCGISSVAEIERAKVAGIDTIITDHHMIPDVLPPAFAIIHPKISGESYPFRYLAGGGVAFKLAQGLMRSPECHLTAEQREMAEKWLLDLVALSSVADMVELVGENRILVKYGLLVMRKNRRLGLRELFRAGSIDPARITAQTIGYQIAPRINAAGRMDHANTAYMLLNASEIHEAQRLANLLERQNRERQKMTERIAAEASAMARGQEGAAVIAVNTTWPVGLTGLIAGKLSKDFSKPAFVITSDEKVMVGSGRSPDGINIMEALVRLKEHLIAFGGHPQACGFRFETSQLDTVSAKLTDYFSSRPRGEAGAGSLKADAEIGFGDIHWELIEYLRRFEPFGQGNPEPLFYTTGVRVELARAVGSSGNHLKLIVSHGARKLPAIGFGLGGGGMREGDRVRIAYHISVNEWNGNREIQLIIKDIADDGS